LSLCPIAKYDSMWLLYDPKLVKLASISGDRRLQGNNRKFRGSKKQHSVPNAHVRSEIKDLEQVRKERQKKANKISNLKGKPSKGKKFNRNGKRGKAK
jgi:ATP-dependent RNA helicase DDX54/DBP10